MAKRRVVAMVDPDPEWVSLVDKGAARKTFRVLKRDDGTSALIEGDAHRVTKDNIDNLAKHFEKAEHPFAACMSELAEQYPDEDTRKQVCGAVKARIGKSDVGETSLRKSMIAALKARVGVLRQLFDEADSTPDPGDPGDEAGDGQGAAIIGAVFDRTLFQTVDAVKAWLDANQIVGDIETTADTFRVTCTALDSEISENDKLTGTSIGTQPFDAGVVLLVRKEAYEFPVTTSPDVVDGHVHRIESLNAYQDGWTMGAGAPMHIHRIIAGIVVDTTGAVKSAGETYNSSHSGSVRSIAMTAETTKAAEGGNQGRQRMKKEVAAPDAPGADSKQKGLGDGPASHVDFRSGIADVETSPGIFQAFDLMQRVLFNTLNDKDITEKAQHIADNLTEFSNFILGQVGKFSPEVVVEEQKHFAIKADPAADPKADPKATDSGAPADAGDGKGEVKSLMTELVVLLREALGKTAPGAPPPANGQQQTAPATKTDKLDEVKELVEKIGERLGQVERGVVGRRGVSEVTNTPESVMAQKRAQGEGSFDNLFPWGAQDGANTEDY